MTIATLLIALIATTAADATGDPVLLDFHASWCGPCREMRPEVEKLVQKGYPVKSVDIDRSPDLKVRYRVEAVPTYVVIDSRGKTLARSSGKMPAAQLAAFYNEAKLKAAAAGPMVEAQERGDVEDVPADEAPSDEPGPANLVNPKPWQTVVRIKMHLSDSEWGFGSGTIIYSSAEESMILTCAHIFRVKGQQQPLPRNFRVPISVDLFSNTFVRREPSAMLACTEKDIPGQAIDYDFTNDVGLIRIRPGRKLAASPVVPPSWRPQKGMKMVTVGCSHGADATAWDTQILNPRIPMSNTETKQSFATIKCAFQPKEGRSGGGLYTSDGYVAGVCDFADPNEHVGLYAVPEAIHKLLDKNQLAQLYKPSNNGALLASRTRTKAATGAGTKVRAQNGEETANPDDVTLPPPNFVGITSPSTDPNAKAWRSRSDQRAEPSRSRPLDRPEVADAVDPGARPGEALRTDLAINPGDEARAYERLEAPAAPAPERAGASPSTTKPQTSGWRGVRQARPELTDSRPAAR